MKNKLICPNCNKKRNFEGSSLEQYFKHKKITVNKKNIKDLSKSNRWACAHCLKKGKAQLPNYKKQSYGLQGPLSTYSDVPKTCFTCNQAFVFSANEQRYWYETLKFNLKSSPKNCPKCRSILRRKK